MIWDFKNFKESEFYCKCGCYLPTAVEVHYYGMVFYFLQPLRTHIGKKIHITSGYRCPNHNIVIGGAVRSYHTIPENPTFYHPCAVDFWVENMDKATALRLFMDFFNLEYMGFHIYTRPDETWLCHIDWRGNKTRW